MNPSKLPVGSFVRIEKAELQAVVDQLRRLGYRTLGPQVADGAVIYADLQSVAQLPVGWIDQQDGGSYRLEASGDGWFDYVVGPHSPKNWLFPPRETIVQLRRKGESWQVSEPEGPPQPLALIGVRSCELHAIEIQDRVFMGQAESDPAYRARRQQLFLLAVNCRRAAATCFCHSMNTGPAVTAGFDLALTELDDRFVVQIGTERGGQVIAAAEWSPCTMADVEAARTVPESLRQQMRKRSSTADSRDGAARGRWLDTTDLPALLLDNLEHDQWEATAQRCLACANCTMVCPTCFCSSVEEVTDLHNQHVCRQRTWASCFTDEHSYMSSGIVRNSIASRYRQWLTHKLATWHNQFRTSGCVGCGRCITWCPVGIDLTEVVAAIRQQRPSTGAVVGVP